MPRARTAVDGAADEASGAVAGATGRRSARRSDKVSELIAREMVHDIAARGLTPGTMLPSESVMLARYRVGRASLREALRILEVHGLIAIKPGPGGGPVVAAIDSQDYGRTSTFYFHVVGGTFRELLDARQFLEPMMARLAAQNQDEHMLRQLKEVVGRAHGAALENDADWSNISTDFHDVVAGATGNRILDLFGRALKDIYHDRIRSLVFPADAREAVRKDHEAIAKAIINGEPARAERLMSRHMQEFVGFVVDRYPGLLDEVVDWR
jgi:DNA-binding FadR family transcriptional regulator